MTMAVCFKCGAIKFGAFVPCPECRAGPQTEDDVALSLAMTDHYHGMPALEQMGADIRAGRPPRLDPQTRRQLLAGMPRGMLRRIQRMSGEVAAAPLTPGPPERNEAGPGATAADGDRGGQDGRNAVIILAPVDPAELERRLPDGDGFGGFLEGCVKAADAYEAACVPPVGHDVQLGIALTPGGRLLLHIATTARDAAGLPVDDLRRAVEGVPRPAVTRGPIVFLIRKRVCGGARGAAGDFGPPFGNLLDSASGDTLEARVIVDPEIETAS
jgi:hypothetical protein